MEFEVKRIADMNRAAYNPRVDLRPEDEEYQAIERSLKRHGLVQPIVWNRRTNTVVSGHQRLTVLEAQGETEVTVSVVDLDDIQEKELNVATINFPSSSTSWAKKRPTLVSHSRKSTF